MIITRGSAPSERQRRRENEEEIIKSGQHGVWDFRKLLHYKHLTSGGRLTQRRKLPHTPRMDGRPLFTMARLRRQHSFSIQEISFDIERSGTNAGALLGKGVYCTAMHYAKSKPAHGIIFELCVRQGRCKTLRKDDPTMKSWQDHSYDRAWAPEGAKRKRVGGELRGGS